MTILDAIRWVALACEKVSPETIQKCFKKAGILSTYLEVVSRFIENEEDPFADLEDHNEGTNLDEDLDAVELQYLMEQLKIPAVWKSSSKQTLNCLPVKTFLGITGKKIFSIKWLVQVRSKAQCLELVDSEDEEEEEKEDDEIHQLKLKTFKEAI